MTLDVTTTSAADLDIEDIITYLGGESPAAAAKFAREILICFQTIGEMPEIGAAVPGFRISLRRMRVSPRFRHWLVFYRRLDQNTIEIMRVQHGARDIASQLQNLR